MGGGAAELGGEGVACRLRKENDRLREEMRTLSEDKQNVLKKKSYALSEASLDPSEFVFHM